MKIKCLGISAFKLVASAFSSVTLVTCCSKSTLRNERVENDPACAGTLNIALARTAGSCGNEGKRK